MEAPPDYVPTPYENWLEKMITIRGQFPNTTSNDELFNNRFDDYINVLRSVPAKIKLTIHDENIYQIPVFVDDDGKISIHQDIWQAWRDSERTSVRAPASDGFDRWSEYHLQVTEDEERD